MTEIKARESHSNKKKLIHIMKENKQEVECLRTEMT